MASIIGRTPLSGGAAWLIERRPHEHDHADAPHAEHGGLVPSLQAGGHAQDGQEHEPQDHGDGGRHGFPLARQSAQSNGHSGLSGNQKVLMSMPAVANTPMAANNSITCWVAVTGVLLCAYQDTARAAGMRPSIARFSSRATE